MRRLLSLRRTRDAQSDPHHWTSTPFAQTFIGVALASVLPAGVAVVGGVLRLTVS